jgi:hypothetical protein
MTDAITVRPIRHMEFTGDAGAKEVALVVTDAGGETRGYVINPATLRAFLEPLISLAATWSGDPDFSTEGLAGPRNALAARQILFTRGRDDSEAAVRVFLGRDIDLNFLLPLNAVMNAFQAFARNVQVVKPQQTN